MMRPAVLSYAIILCLLLLGFGLSPVGCSSRQRSDTVTYGSIGWESGDAEQAVSGIDQAMLAWCMRGEQLSYVVWTDLRGGGGSNSGSDGSSSSGLVHDQTHLNSSDGVRFDFEYTLDTNNKDSGNPGTVTIGGVDYPLKDGALVLVSTKGVEVKQLDFGPTIIDQLHKKSQSPESLRKALKSLANDHPDVRGFFESVKHGN
jgi:hypothetical protein